MVRRSSFRPIRGARRAPTIDAVAITTHPFLTEPRVADAPRRVWRDWPLVGLASVAAVIEALVRTDIPYRWAVLAAALLAIPFTLWRRTHPLRVALVVFLPSIALDITRIVDGEHRSAALGATVVLLTIPYAGFRWGSGREAVAGLGVVCAAATLTLIADRAGIGDVIGGVAVLSTTAAIGIAVRYRQRARVKGVDEARAHERERLARDLHDTVAHRVSAIAIHAQAGIVTADRDPEAATAALRVIADEASRTLTEMRTLVRGLRRDTDDAALGLDDVRLLADGPAEGPPVHVELVGDTATVPAPVATAAYRLVQESVTNARRHAREASRIDVRVHAGHDTVELEVADDGAPASGRRPDEGYGIVGMAERAEQLGGRLTAGPRPGRGWSVQAVLPLRGSGT